jgi:hypothetical protein
LSIGAEVAVLLPFLVVRGNLTLAIESSKLVGIATLFLIGYYRSQNKRLRQRLSAGTASAVLGTIITAITIALGGG